MSEKIFCLRNIDLYEGISEKELIALADNAYEDWVAQGDVLYSENEPCHAIFVLKKGEIELCHKEGDKTVVLETLIPGDVFGDFGTGKKENHFARAARASYLCKTPTDEFLHIVQAHPEIALRLIQLFAKKTDQYENRIASLSKPAKELLFDTIISLKDKNNRRFFGKIFQTPFRMSHEQLAGKTGLNRVTVTKLMNELKREGRIKMDEKGAIEVRSV